MYSKPTFLQGVQPFTGMGFEKVAPLAEALNYTVPNGRRAQLIYFRAGNSSEEMICIVLLRDGKPMRYFPIGAKSATHVALAVVEDMMSETLLEVALAAPEGATGTVIVDIGLMEI